MQPDSIIIGVRATCTSDLASLFESFESPPIFHYYQPRQFCYWHSSAFNTTAKLSPPVDRASDSEFLRNQHRLYMKYQYSVTVTVATVRCVGVLTVCDSDCAR